MRRAASLPNDLRVHLQRPAARHELAYLEGVRRSAALHRGYVTCASTGPEYREYLRRTRRRNQESFFVVRDDGAGIAGVINVNEIVRYSFQSASLGYYAFVPHAGLGLMREGLELVIDRCFGVFGLHRLEANIQPSNHRSIALVRALGFEKEGLSRRYLKIGGRWRDHERWALLADA